jgi:hypothetical protein
MSRFQIISILVVIALMGWLQLIFKIRRTNEKEKYALKYFDSFKKYVESKGKDNEAYTWMTYESVKMQNQLGILGIMSNYKPPGANYIFKNYPVLVNMLPDLHSSFNSDYLIVASPWISNYIQVLQEMLVRHLGVLNKEKKDIQSEINNPFKAFRAGIQLLLLLPFSIVSWFGLATKDFLWRLSRNPLVKIISGVFAIIMFISAIVSLVVGWKYFVIIVKSIF